jgi:putative flippase GtrA
MEEENRNVEATAGQSAGSRIISLLTSEGMRYLVIGGCTTLVNLVVYAVLCRVVGLNVNVSNIISVSVSIIFAYVTNKLIVFRSHCSSWGELAAECARFIGARLATMAIEVGGVFLIYNVMHQDEMIAKLATQVLVVIGNYFISRFIVFRDRK